LSQWPASESFLELIVPFSSRSSTPIIEVFASVCELVEKQKKEKL
jgi:hypothetical protein